MFDVFLSYRRSDGAALAETVYRFLTSKGLRVFYDKEKMEDSRYFNEQIVSKLTEAPHYILLATADVFPFRTGETDWVEEEIGLAVRLYEEDMDGRSLGVIRPGGTDFPFDGLPREIENLKYANQIPLEGPLPSDDELKRILKSVCRVDRHNLWNAGHRQLENGRRKGGRFAGLNIAESLMPLAESSGAARAEFPIQIARREEEAPSGQRSLPEALAETKGHLYLIGQGGIGKTTALISIMDAAYRDKTYEKTAQIPLFIELSRAPDTYGRLYENGHSTFVRRAVYQLLRSDRRVKQFSSRTVEAIDDAFDLDPETAVEPVEDLFTKEAPAPEYLLLLDGLNEASRTVIRDGRGSELPPVAMMLIGEVRELMACPNVRIILTSRSDEEAVFGEITRLYLRGVEEETVRAYLEGGGMAPAEIDDALKSEPLAETLRIPLFLTMYAALRDKAAALTQGEIFRTFFHERERELPVYTAQNRIAEAEEALASAASAKQPLRMTRRMQWFILDFLLPELARHMERKGLFRMDAEDCLPLFERVLTGASDTDVCGRYGRKLFGKYGEGSSSLREHTESTAKALLALADGDGSEAGLTVLECGIFSLGVLTLEEGRAVAFRHHHVRDYFAAVRNLTDLRLAEYLHRAGSPEAFACLRDFNEKPVRSEVRRFMGEALGEGRNRPYYDGGWRCGVPAESCDRNLLKRVLELYRGRPDGGAGYGLYNLIGILKQTRGDLSGADLSELDLRSCSLNGTRLGRPGLAASLRGSRLARRTLFYMGQEGRVLWAEYSPDGKYFVTVSPRVDARVWDAETIQCIRVLKGDDRGPYKASFSPDGKRIVATFVNRFFLWDLASGRCVVKSRKLLRTDILSAAYSPDGRSIVTASTDKCARIWDAETGRCLRVLRGHTAEVRSAVCSPDGKRIVTASKDKTVRIWDFKTGKCVRILDGHTAQVNSAAYSPDGKHIVTASKDKTARIWDPETGQCVGVVDEHTSPVLSAAYDPDGHRVVTSSEESIQIWDAVNRRRIGRMSVYDNSVHTASYCTNGKLIISATWDGAVSIWDKEIRQHATVIKGFIGVVNSVAYSPDCRYIAAAYEDGPVRLLDAETGRCMHILEVQTSWHLAICHSVSFSADGKTLAGEYSDGMIRLWDTGSGQCVKKVECWGHWVNPVEVADCPSDAFMKDPDHISDVWIRDKETGHAKALKGHRGLVVSAAYSPNGKRVVTGGSVGPARIWDTETGQCVLMLECAGSVNCVAFNPDGKRVITFSSDSLQIFDADTGRRISKLDGSFGVTALAVFNPDGKHIALVFDGTVRVWNAETERWVKKVKIAQSQTSAAYSPDGMQLALASLDGIVRILDAQTLESIRTLRSAPGLLVQGVDLRGLLPSPEFSEQDRDDLRTYGALID